MINQYYGARTPECRHYGAGTVRRKCIKVQRTVFGIRRFQTKRYTSKFFFSILEYLAKILLKTHNFVNFSKRFPFFRIIHLIVNLKWKKLECISALHNTILEKFFGKYNILLKQVICINFNCCTTKLNSDHQTFWLLNTMPQGHWTQTL